MGEATLSREENRLEQPWLSVLLPSTINGTKLLAQEFCDALFMRYGITPPDLPHTCDGCESHSLYNMRLVVKKVAL